MIKHFHVKMLSVLAISAFVIGLIYLLIGSRSGTDRVAGPVGGLFCMFGLFASITAGAILSINRRLDGAGIKDDSEYPTSLINKKSEQDAASEGDKPCS